MATANVSAAASLRRDSPLTTLVRQTSAGRGAAVAHGPSTASALPVTPRSRPDGPRGGPSSPPRRPASPPFDGRTASLYAASYSENEGDSDASRASRSIQSQESCQTDDAGPFAFQAYETRTRSASPTPLPQTRTPVSSAGEGDDTLPPEAEGDLTTGDMSSDQHRDGHGGPPAVETAAGCRAPRSADLPPNTGRSSPSQAGRLPSQAPTRRRNYSRPSTVSDFSPSNSISTVHASTSAAKLEESILQPSRSAPWSPVSGSTALRPSPSASSDPGLLKARPGPAHMNNFTFPVDTSPLAAPSLSTGPSSASSHGPATPGTAHPVPWPTQPADLEAYGPPPGLSQSKSAEQCPFAMRHVSHSRVASMTDSEEAHTVVRSSGRWRFWKRKSTSRHSTASLEGPAKLRTASAAPSLATDLKGSPDRPFVEPDIEFRRALHRREVSEADRLFQRRQRQDPPIAHLQTAYSHDAGRTRQIAAEDETEFLADTATHASRLTDGRVATPMSTYSVYSVTSSADDVPPAVVTTRSIGTPRQVSSETATTERPSSSRPTPSSVMKAKASLEMLRPPLMNHGQLPGRQDRALSADIPEDCLQLGITCHERGELERSALYFERSATLKGGCGMGMLLWGLTLRHGWGCAVDQEKGFAFLQQAAESVVDDLDAAVQHKGEGFAAGDLEAKATKGELVLSIYELGMSFRKGWGVRQDKALALSYFKLASTLGDPDAQQELGFAYLYGKGCRKDKQKSAHYYRLAAKQGLDTFGQQWIWRRKYGGTED